MFESLQLKLVTIFVLLVLAIMTVAGTFLVLRVYIFHHDKFQADMAAVFTDEFISELQNGPAEEKNYIAKKLSKKSHLIGVDDYRKYYIVNAEDSLTIGGMYDEENIVYLDSSNYRTALSEGKGKRIDYAKSYMDYAIALETDEGKVIIYVCDNKGELNTEILAIIISCLQVLLVSVVVIAIIVFFVVRRISVPISTLTKSAKQISEGEFDTKIEPTKRNDEIGMLVEAVRDMSGKFRKTISDFSTEKNKIEAIIQNMTDGVIAFDTKGRIIHINSTARKMLNVEKIEKYKFDRLFAELEANIKIGDLLYLDNNRFCEREIIKGNLTLKVSFAVFNNERKKTDGVLTVFHDVTKQQRLEMSRREFVANVSHELKTPLTTVKSHAETLLDIIGDNKTAEIFTNTILNETDRMTRLVKDLLLISSVEGKMVLNQSLFSLKDMINDVVSTMSLVANEKGHRLNFEAVAEIPDYYGDRDKLEQVLYNVISNSIKYTPNGGKINIKAGRLYADFFVEVKDNGMGIPEKDLDRIFERFYRVDKARSRELGGTGLGLSISKSIIDAHGGSIKVDSKVGEGTKVIISLPVIKGKQS